MACSCDNPKCPNATRFGNCRHCMCLTSPDFGQNATIGYSGPIHHVCCKCGYSVAYGASRTSNHAGTV